MNSSNVGRSLRVLFLALCGLSVYALLFALLFLVVGLVIPRHAHANALSESRFLMSH